MLKRKVKAHTVYTANTADMNNVTYNYTYLYECSYRWYVGKA